MARHPSANSVVVLGLGRFGMAVAGSLVRLGHDVLGIDENPDTVQRCADAFTHVAQADGTSTEALRALGVAEFQRAVVGIGSDIEASVLTVLALEELGVPDIWARPPAPSAAAFSNAPARTTWCIPRPRWANGSRTWSPGG